MKILRTLIANIHSLWHDGRTLKQKRRYIYKHHPVLYKYLYEERTWGVTL